MDFKEQLFQLFEVEAEQAELILSKFHKETLVKNVQLLEEGQSCRSLSFIANGYCRVFKWTGSKEATQWIGGAGYFVTDLASFLFDKPAGLVHRNPQPCDPLDLGQGRLPGV